MDNWQDAPGLVCPRCGCRHFEVTHTEKLRNRIRRRRRCRHCGRRLVTLELTLPDVYHSHHDDDRAEPPGQRPV